jgi:hypothetical protein
MLEREGPHMGALVWALRKATPDRASLLILGVKALGMPFEGFDAIVEVIDHDEQNVRVFIFLLFTPQGASGGKSNNRAFSIEPHKYL